MNSQLFFITQKLGRHDPTGTRRPHDGRQIGGEAPEYTLEQWLRCDPLWPHVFDAPAYAHLQSTLDAVQIMPDEENRFNALKAVFSQLMTDATLTPLFNYHYRISALPA